MTSLATTNSTNSVTAASVAASTTATTAGTPGSGGATLTQADFLQLLTAQLKYQSPTNPADPTQMASEFAQIATVDGVDNLETDVTGLQSSSTASKLGQAGDLVGKQVAVAGDTLTANSAGTATGAFTLPTAAADATATILNANGSVAGTMNLGSLSAGQQTFQWTGGAAGNQYSYEISAADGSGAPVQATTYSVYTVQGVNLSSTNPTLNVQGSATPLAASSITTVLGAS